MAPYPPFPETKVPTAAEPNLGDEDLATWFKAPFQSVATRQEKTQKPRALHKHDFIELVIVIGGEGVHLLEGTRHPIASGDTFVIPPNIRHGYADTQDLELCNILIRNQHLQTLERECFGMPGFYALFKLEPHMRATHQLMTQLRLSSTALDEISTWFQALERETNQSIPLACTRARAFLQLIVAHLCIQYEQLGSINSAVLLQIANCLHFMDSHLDTSLHLADLARAAGMSERSLSRSFHMTLGQSPIEYLLNVRLQRAEELLLAGPTAISQIAFEVGFRDANYFTRQFRRRHGLSPRQYRKQFRKL